MPHDMHRCAGTRVNGGWPVRGAGGLLAVLALLAAMGSVSAATVYRCGSGGRVFSQTPCPHEDGQRLEVDGEISGARQAEALEVSRREAATARAMGRHGESRPARASGARAAVIPLREVSVGGPATPAKMVRPKRRDTPRDFTAKVPKPEKAVAPVPMPRP